jgi:hypothetical protein
MLHLITVATHAESHFVNLENSCAYFGYPVKVLGWGDKYPGHYIKDVLVLKYISQLPDDDIVVFVDGFDSVCVRPLNDLEHSFKNSGCDLIISVDNVGKEYTFTKNPLWAYLYWRAFSLWKGKCVNSGMYIGYVKTVRAFIQSVQKQAKKINYKSNQREWIKTLKWSNETKHMNVSLDQNGQYFFNYLDLFNDKPDIKIINGTQVIHTCIKNQETPFYFLSAPANSNIDFIVEKLPAMSPIGCKKVKCVNRALNNYLPVFKIEIIILLILFGCLFLFLRKRILPFKVQKA